MSRLPGSATDPWSCQSYATANKARDESEERGQQVHLKKHVNRQPATVGKFKQFSRTDLEQEIRYLSDPLKLAQNTLDLLHKDEAAKALEIVRLASRTTASTVSWNHIIDYHLSKGRVAESLKVYNDVLSRMTIISIESCF